LGLWLHPLARGVNASQSARRRPWLDAPMVKEVMVVLVRRKIGD
jgi:hypothetical protein